jgi:hypothetical protein
MPVPLKNRIYLILSPVLNKSKKRKRFFLLGLTRPHAACVPDNAATSATPALQRTLRMDRHPIAQQR